MSLIFMKEILERSPIIPVVTIDNKEDACQLATLLQHHGFNSLEITLRTPNALEVINCVAQEFKTMAIGAGTINDNDTMEEVVQSQARFAVSPGFSPALTSLASMYDLPYLPGVATASEVIQASAFGLNCFKLFPAEVIGGVAWLKSVANVFPESFFCPTGGINFDNAPHYLAQRNVLSIGMSTLVPKDLLAKRDWQGINAILAQAAELQQSLTQECE